MLCGCVGGHQLCCVVKQVVINCVVWLCKWSSTVLCGCVDGHQLCCVDGHQLCCVVV